MNNIVTQASRSSTFNSHAHTINTPKDCFSPTSEAAGEIGRPAISSRSQARRSICSTSTQVLVDWQPPRPSTGQRSLHWLHGEMTLQVIHPEPGKSRTRLCFFQNDPDILQTLSESFVKSGRRLLVGQDKHILSLLSPAHVHVCGYKQQYKDQLLDLLQATASAGASPRSRSARRRDWRIRTPPQGHQDDTRRTGPVVWGEHQRPASE